jgi:hypothetical protein
MVNFWKKSIGSTDKNSGGLFSHVQNVISEFDLGSKLVAHVCDRGVSYGWTLECYLARSFGGISTCTTMQIY